MVDVDSKYSVKKANGNFYCVACSILDNKEPDVLKGLPDGNRIKDLLKEAHKSLTWTTPCELKPTCGNLFPDFAAANNHNHGSV